MHASAQGQPIYGRDISGSEGRGGTSPFGTRKRMTVYVQKTIYDLPEIYINAGHRGILVAMAPKDLDVVLSGLTVPVDVAIA